MDNYTLKLTKNEMILIVDALLQAEEKTQKLKHNFQSYSKETVLNRCTEETTKIIEKLEQQEDDLQELQNKIKDQANEQENN